jgi:HAD superfamily hydrolase (TIGR01509 family)
MPEFDAILFDFDGVLVDSEPVHWACWAEVLAPLGVMLEWEFYRDYCIGIDDREMLRMMAGRSTPPRQWESLWTRYPAKKDLFRGRMSVDPPFPPGTAALLGRLRTDYRLAVVSSSSTDEIEPMLAAGGLRNHFETVVGGNNVKRHKPAPDAYLLAAERLNARTALVVEDSEAGLAAGRAAGFQVLRVNHPDQVPNLLLQRLGMRAL